MDNNAYNQDPEKGTELSLVPETSTSKKYRREQSLTSVDEKRKHCLRAKSKSPTEPKSKEIGTNTTPRSAPTAGAGGAGAQEPGPSSSCKPEVCQRARERFAAPDLRGSPWHRRKTIFLITTIVLLCSWAIVYSMLSKWDII